MLGSVRTQARMLSVKHNRLPKDRRRPDPARTVWHRPSSEEDVGSRDPASALWAEQYF
jgi:hypothetical protein